MDIVKEYKMRCNVGDDEFPSPGQLSDLIVDFAMDKIPTKSTPEALEQSRKMTKRTWVAKFAKITYPRNKPITEETLMRDPHGSVDVVLINLYTKASFVYELLNANLRKCTDPYYVDTFGPLAQCLRTILYRADWNKEGRIKAE